MYKGYKHPDTPRQKLIDRLHYAIYVGIVSQEEVHAAFVSRGYGPWLEIPTTIIQDVVNDLIKETDNESNNDSINADERSTAGSVSDGSE